MGAAIGQALPLAVGVALSPVPIIAVVLMLMSARARLNGPGFVLGWLVGLGALGAIVLAVAGPASAGDEGGHPATWASVLKLALGLLLIGVAVRQWRGRPKPGQDAEAPKWMGSIEHFSPPKATGAGVVLSAVNPKNTLLAVAAATGIAQPGSGPPTRPSPTPCSRSWPRSAWPPR